MDAVMLRSDTRLGHRATVPDNLFCEADSRCRDDQQLCVGEIKVGA
jgi:hypothetical protein